MRYIHGKEVLETLEEIADPRHSALLVIDVQNDFCHPQSWSGKCGRDLSMMPEMIEHLRVVLAEARRQPLLRIFFQSTHLPDGLSDSGPWMYRNLSKGITKNPETDFCEDGTWGHQIVDELQPGAGELVIKKHRSDGFHQTNLDLILRDNGIKTVIATGVVTEGCVDSTVRSALFHDYYAVVPTDCVASQVRAKHDASLLISKADLCTTNELLRLWANAPVPVRAS